MPFLPTSGAMDLRRLSVGLVPRIVAVVGVGIAATAGVTWAASQGLPQTGAVSTVTTAAVPPIVVPDVQNEAFVFAKGTLEDDGFAWKVAGPVEGYAANTVVSQSPAPGTPVIDTGAPLVTLTLSRNARYGEKGEAEDVSPYAATLLQRADLASAVGPAVPAQTTAKTPAVKSTAPAVKTKTAAKKKTATTTTKKTATTATTSTAPSTWPKSRPAAFVVAGAKKEPLDEMPLNDRAQALGRWLLSHRTPTSANVRYWLYQNAWVVAGARLGWWNGAQALQTLIAVDHQTEALWQLGSRSESAARQALSYVTARTKQ
jgi:PASTA domain